jgi:hypothetical protein
VNHFATAARRLRLAAAVFEDRAYHPQRLVIETTVRAAQLAADAFDGAAPGEPEELPEELADALATLDAVAGAHDFHLSPALFGYAVAPVTGEVPPMEPLNAVGEQLYRQDFDLQARRNAVVMYRHLDSKDDETVMWALRALATIHYKHERLAVEVELDNKRPCNEGKTPFHLLPRPRRNSSHRG